MSTEAFNNHKLIQEIVQTSFIDRVGGNFEVLNAGSGGAFSFEDRFVSGNTSGEVYLNDLAETDVYRDPTADSDQVAIEWSEDEIYSVKRYRGLKEVDIRRETLVQKRQTAEQWSARTGAKYGFDAIRHAIKAGVSVLVPTIEGYTDSGSNNALVVDKSTEAFKLSHLIDLASMYDDTGVQPVTLFAHKNQRTMLKKLGLNAGFERLGGAILQGGEEATLGLSIVYVENSELLVTDVDESASGNQAGFKMLLLPSEAVKFRRDSAPEIDFYRIRQKTNLKWGVQGEYAYTFGTRGWSWTGTYSEAGPSDTAFATLGNWTAKKDANLANLNGFMLKARNSAASVL